MREIPIVFDSNEKIREYMQSISNYTLSSIAKQNYCYYHRKCKIHNCNFEKKIRTTLLR